MARDRQLRGVCRVAYRPPGATCNSVYITNMRRYRAVHLWQDTSRGFNMLACEVLPTTVRGRDLCASRSEESAKLGHDPDGPASDHNPAVCDLIPDIANPLRRRFGCGFDCPIGDGSSRPWDRGSRADKCRHRLEYNTATCVIETSRPERRIIKWNCRPMNTRENNENQEPAMMVYTLRQYYDSI
ncbi:hypothetical protein CALVIDRAFT_534719, partial [Calocera viscosa TUFC12733]